MPQLLWAAYGSLKDEERCIAKIKEVARVSDDEFELQTVNSYADRQGSILYLDQALNVLDVDIPDTDRAYMWIDTGFTRNRKNVYGSFYKTSFGWEGALIGTPDIIEKAIRDRSYRTSNVWEEKVSELASIVKSKGNVDNREVERLQEDKVSAASLGISEEELDALGRSKLFGSLYSRLLMKENWAAHKGKDRLKKHVTFTAQKALNSYMGGESNGLIVNSDRTVCIVNTGLLDKYLNDIYFGFYIDSNCNLHSPWMVESKAELTNKGFVHAELKSMPEPVKFVRSDLDLLFRAGMEDFDIESSYRLDHIIEERRYRFPSEIKEMSSDVIYAKLKSAVERALKMNKRDYKYIVPMYNIKQDCIQFLMPLHIEKSIEEVPELAAVVGIVGDYYSIMTVLDIEDAYFNARLIAKPGSSWLRVGENTGGINNGMR